MTDRDIQDLVQTMKNTYNQPLLEDKAEAEVYLGVVPKNDRNIAKLSLVAMAATDKGGFSCLKQFIQLSWQGYRETLFKDFNLECVVVVTMKLTVIASEDTREQLMKNEVASGIFTKPSLVIAVSTPEKEQIHLIPYETIGNVLVYGGHITCDTNYAGPLFPKEAH